MTLTTESLQNIIKAIQPYMDKGQTEELDIINSRLSEIISSKIKILVCGEFKRGKSSFVNAFLGRNLCAVDQDICTSVVSIIKYGDKERVVRNYGALSDIKQEEIPFDRISEYSVGSASEVQNTLYLEIELPIDILKNDLVIIDTPGVGGLDPRHAFITTYFLPLADITLFMTDVNEPLTITELEFFKDKVAKYAERNIVIVNKSDLKPIDQVETIKNDTVAKIAEYCSLTDNKISIYTTSSKSKLNYDKTKNGKLLDKSGFKAVYEEIESTVSDVKNQRIELIQSALQEFLDNIITPLQLQLNQIEMPDPKIISDLKQREADMIARSKALNDPSSEFRVLVQRKITEYREAVINHLNDKSIMFTSTGLSKVLNDGKAKTEEGARWVASRLNSALESLGAEIELELNDAFTKIASMKEFEGMLKYNVKSFEYQIKTMPTSKRKVPIHKQLMSLMPGMGAGVAANVVASSVLGLLGAGIASVAAPIVAVAVGLGIAVKSHSDIINDTELMNLREQYQPQIMSAIQQLRTFVETRFTEFQQELMSVIMLRVKNEQSSMQNLVKEITLLSNNQKLALSKKIAIEKRLKLLAGQRENLVKLQ